MLRHFTGLAASSRGLLASFSACCCAALLLLSGAPQPAFAQLSDPGGVDETEVALPFEPGSTYPWEGSTDSGINTGNGNKLTTIPLVGWSGKGAMPVSLSLFHNSQGQGVSELGPKWTHSFDLYLVLDPATDRATVHWGNDLSYPFTLDDPTGLYVAPQGIWDTLHYTTDDAGAFTSFTLSTKGGLSYQFSNPSGNRWRCQSITDRNNNQITISHNGADFVTSVTDPSGRTLTFVYDADNKLNQCFRPDRAPVAVHLQWSRRPQPGHLSRSGWAGQRHQSRGWPGLQQRASHHEPDRPARLRFHLRLLVGGPLCCGRRTR